MSDVRSPEPPFAVALRLAAAGFSVLPIRPDGSKAPAVHGSWTPWQTRIASPDEIRGWFNSRLRGVAVIGGAVSGSLECLDFDELGIFERWADDMEVVAPELLRRLVIVKTPSGGHHCWYRCDAAMRTVPLARRFPTEAELARNAKLKWVVMVETRAEGSYALVPGSPKECHHDQRTYEYLPLGAGPLTSVNRITPEEREMLHGLARQFETYFDQQPAPTGRRNNDDGVTPGDAYDASGPDWQTILEPHGWTLFRGTWERGTLTRPGKDDGPSATVGVARDQSSGMLLFKVFSTNAGVAPGAYGKFRAYAAHNHGGTETAHLSAAAKELAKQGYGTPATDRRAGPRNAPAAPSGAAGALVPAAEVKPWEVKPIQGPPPPGVNQAALMSMILPPPKFAIEGVLCEGLTVLGGRPKMGKSWLSLLIAWAVASEQPIDGRNVAGGDVLYLALEDTRRRLQSRQNKLRGSVPWEFTERLDIRTDWPRNDRGGLYYIAEWLEARRRTARLVIVDTFAKFRGGRRANGDRYAEDYEEVGDLKKLFDHFAVSGMIVTHTRKTRSEDPFEDISGTNGIGGAADGMLVLDRDRSGGSGVLFATGRDIEEVTIPMSLDRASYRWSFGESAEGIVTDDRGVSPTKRNCIAWLRRQLGREYCWPDEELKTAAKSAGFSSGQYYDAKTALRDEGLFVKRAEFGGRYIVGLGDPATMPLRPESLASQGGQEPKTKLPARRKDDEDDDGPRIPDVWTR